MSLPLPFRWNADDRKFEPLPNFIRDAMQMFAHGRIYRLVELEERSEVSHRQEFAWLREAWQTLPDALKREYPSTEHLRKRGLIETGHCTMQDYVCGSKAEAVRWAANLRRELDEYTVIQPSESVVRVFRAKSQARAAMNKTEFQASKNDLLEWVAGLLAVSAATLERQREAA